jgi:hypothetical protein
MVHGIMTGMNDGLTTRERTVPDWPAAQTG